MPRISHQKSQCQNLSNEAFSDQRFDNVKWLKTAALLPYTELELVLKLMAPRA